MTKTDLEALAVRVEGLSGPDRNIDILVALAADWSSPYAPYPLRQLADVMPLEEMAQDADRHTSILNQIPRYTASIDAAMTLVPNGMIWVLANVGAQSAQPDMRKASANVGHIDDASGPVEAATPALALTAAALRALSASEK